MLAWNSQRQRDFHAQLAVFGETLMRLSPLYLLKNRSIRFYSHLPFCCRTANFRQCYVSPASFILTYVRVFYEFYFPLLMRVIAQWFDTAIFLSLPPTNPFRSISNYYLLDSESFICYSLISPLFSYFLVCDFCCSSE